MYLLLAAARIRCYGWTAVHRLLSQRHDEQGTVRHRRRSDIDLFEIRHIELTMKMMHASHSQSKIASSCAKSNDDM